MIKKLLLILILVLSLTSCSKAEAKTVYECLYTEDSGYGEYIEVFNRFTANGDEIELDEIYQNWVFTYEVVPEEADKMVAEYARDYKGVSNVTYENRFDKYLYQEAIKLDYKNADLEKLVEAEIIDPVAGGKAPDFISVELSVKDLESQGFKCQKVEEGKPTLQDEMYIKEYNYDGQKAYDELPELQLDYRSGKGLNESDIVTKCSISDPEAPELVNYVELHANQKTDTVLKSFRHEEFTLDDESPEGLKSVEKQAQELGKEYNQIPGLNYVFSFKNNKYFVQETTIDYAIADFDQLVELGVLETVDGETPDYISYQSSIEGYTQAGLVCGE